MYAMKRKLNKEKELITNIKKGKTSSLVYIMRNSNRKLLKLDIKGKIEGKRGLRRCKHPSLKQNKRLDWFVHNFELHKISSCTKSTLFRQNSYRP